MNPPLRAAVFLDKDGTLIENRPYNVDCSKIRLAEGAVEATKSLCRAGYQLVMVTNQSGIAKGLFSIRDLRGVEHFLRKRLCAEGVPLAGFYFCPHHPKGGVSKYARKCNCRKPQPGLLFQAASELNIDLERSWFVGDILDDIEAGHRAGCRAVLVDNKSETLWEMSLLRRPEAIATDLISAANFILENQTANVKAGFETMGQRLDNSDYAKNKTTTGELSDVARAGHRRRHVG